MQIQALNIPWGVHRVGLRHDRALGPDPQAKRHPVISQKVDRSVSIPGDLAVGGQIGHEFVEGGLGVDSPDGFMDARLVAVGGG